jgi:hypothetical protein
MHPPFRTRHVLLSTSVAVLGAFVVAACGGGGGDSGTTTTTTTATTSASTTTSTSTTCAQAANFPDVSLTSNYIDWNDDGAAPTITPSVAVTCASGVVSVASNGVPNFDALGNGRGGADVAYQTNQKTWTFPASPVKASATTSLTHTLGAIGVLVNGVQFYTVTEGPQDNWADAVLNGFTNYCGGHVEQYHFHGYPSCFFSKTTVGTTHTFLPDKTPGTVVGYAFDGFPVKTPYESCTSGTDCVSGVREIVSAYRYTGTQSYASEDASAYNVYEAGYQGSTLDACNGKTDADGNYAYYATKRYPYFVGCYTGTPTSNR